MSMSLSMGTQTPGGSTPMRFVNNGIEELPCRDTNGGLNPVGPLMKEFERRRQNFDEEAQAIVEVKSGHSPPVNPVEDLRRLKHRFESWKKDYKVRLKEAKAKAQKLVQNDSEKHRRKWWSKKK
ncbi:UNVERIFIED_CONTAM: Myosin-2 [Sesamum radiatum]